MGFACLGVGLATLSASLWLQSGSGQNAVRRRLESLLSSSTGLQASIGAVDVSLVPARLMLRDVSLAGPGGEVLGVERATAEVALGAAWRRQLAIRSLNVEGPRIRLDLATAPRFVPGAEPSGWSVQVDRLSLSRGTLHFTSASGDLAILADGVNVSSGAFLSDGQLQGTLGVERLNLTSPALSFASARAEARLRAGAGRLDVRALQLDVPAVGRIDATGALSLPADAPATLVADIQADVDAQGALLLFGASAGSALPSGSLELQGRLEGRLAAPALSATFHSQQLLVPLPWATPAGDGPATVQCQLVSGRLTLEGGDIALEDVTATAAGGRLAGTLQWSPGTDSTVDVTARLQGARLGELPLPTEARPVTDLLAASTDIRAALRVPASDPLALDGTFEVTLSPPERPPGSAATALRPRGRIEGTLAAGSFDVRTAGLALADASLSATGGGPFDGPVSFAFTARAPRLSRVLDAVARAVGDEAFENLPVTGSAQLEGTLTSEPDKAWLSGRARVTHASLGGLELGVVTGDIQLSATALRIDAVEARGELADFTGSADIPLVGDAPAVGDWRCLRLDLGALARQLELPREWSGELRGDGRLDATGSSLGVAGRLAGSALQLAGLDVDALHVDATADREGLILRELEARVNGASATAAGQFPWAGDDGRLSASLVDFPVPEPLTGAFLSAEATLTGSLAAWSLAEPARLALVLPPLGPFAGRRLTASATPVPGPGLACDIADDEGLVTGHLDVGLASPWSVAAELQLAPFHLDLGEPADATELDFGQAVATLRGAAGEPDTLVGSLKLDSLRIVRENVAAVTEAPVTLTSRGTQLLLPPLVLLVSEQRLTVSGWADLAAGPAWGLDVSGASNLGVLAPLLPSARLRGPVTLDAELRGLGLAVTASGHASLQGGWMRIEQFPHALEELSGRVTLGAEGLEIDELAGTLGGGPVSVSGNVVLFGVERGRHDLRFRGEHVALRVPRDVDLRSLSDFDVTWKGDGQASRIEGRVDLLSATWGEDLHLESRLLARSSAAPSVPTPGPLDRIALAVRVIARDDCWIDADIAHVEVQADIEVRGTAARPVVVGVIEALDAGRLTFQRADYRLLSASATFTPLHPNDPELAVTADVDLGGVTIDLSLEGRLSAPIVELSSEPELPRERLVALLLSGGAVGGAAGGEMTAESAALTEATRLLLGGSDLLGRAAEGGTGLDLFQLEPTFLEGDGDHAARITLGKRLSERLFAQYSTFLGGAQESAAEARYELTPHVLLRGARESSGAYVGEVRYVRRASGEARRRPHDDDVTVKGLVLAGDAPEGSAPALVKALDLPAGSRRSPLDLRRAGYRARVVLAQAGHPLGRIRCEGRAGDDDASEVEVTCNVSSGPQVELRLDGVDGRLRRRLSAAVAAAWRESGTIEDLGSDATYAALQFLLERGHAHATATESLTLLPELASVVLAVQPGAEVVVNEVRVTAPGGVPEKEAKEALALARRGLRRPRLTPGLLAADRDALAGLHRAQGYLDAVVAEPRITYPAGLGLASVSFVVDAGPAVRLASLDFSGNQELDVAALRRYFAVADGERLSLTALDDGVLAAQAEYDDLGLPDARVSWTLGRDGDEAHVHVVVTEGERAVIGTLKVAGAERTRVGVVLRALHLEPGERFSRAELLASRRRLMRLGVFRSVTVRGEPRPDAPAVRDIVVTVIERDARDVGLGLAWVVSDGPRFSFSLADRNLRGRAASLGIAGAVGGTERRAELVWSLPDVPRQGLDLLGSLGLREEDHASFLERRTTLAVQVARDLSPRTRLLLRFQAEDIALRNLRIDPSAAGLEAGRLAGVGASLVQDTRDHALSPHSGSLTSADLRLDSRLLGSDVGLVRTFIQHARWKPLGERLTWAVGARLGVAWATSGTSTVPLSERFFAGGVTSVRGFARDSLGPRDLVTGNPVGGELLFVLTQELEYRLTRRLGLLAFVDGGNVFERPGDLDLGELRYAAGPGLSFETPAGPLHLTNGFVLDPHSGEARSQLQFSFGPRF